MPRLLLVFLSLVFGLFAFGGLSAGWRGTDLPAQGDTEPPRLVSVQVEPSFVDTTDTSALMTVTFGMTDNLSGAHYASISFAKYSDDGGQASPRVEWFHSPLVPISGTPTNGIYSISTILPQFSPEGRWYLSSVLLDDNTHNNCGWIRGKWETNSHDSTCVAVGDLPYFVNVSDDGPPTASTPTPTPDRVATAVVATLTAIAVNATPEPCDVYLPSIDSGQ